MTHDSTYVMHACDWRPNFFVPTTFSTLRRLGGHDAVGRRVAGPGGERVPLGAPQGNGELSLGPKVLQVVAVVDVPHARVLEELQLLRLVSRPTHMEIIRQILLGGDLPHQLRVVVVGGPSGEVVFVQRDRLDPAQVHGLHQPLREGVLVRSSTLDDVEGQHDVPHDVHVQRTRQDVVEPRVEEERSEPYGTSLSVVREEAGGLYTRLLEELGEYVVEVRVWLAEPHDVNVLEQGVVPHLQHGPDTEGLVPHHVHEGCVQVHLGGVFVHAGEVLAVEAHGSCAADERHDLPANNNTQTK